MKSFTDHLGRAVKMNYPPKRIVSFAPAITDTLYSLELDTEIVGRTRFCVHPKEKVVKATNVGGTKDMKIERIHALKPDIIIVKKKKHKRNGRRTGRIFSRFCFRSSNSKRRAEDDCRPW